MHRFSKKKETEISTENSSYGNKMDGNEIFFNDHARLNSFAGLYPEKHQKATVSYRLETNENLMKVGLAKEISTYS